MDGSGEERSDGPGNRDESDDRPDGPLMEPPDTLGEKVVVYFRHNLRQLVQDVLVYSAWILAMSALYQYELLTLEAYFLLVLLGIVSYSIISSGWEIPWHDEASLYAKFTDVDEDELRESIRFDQEEEGWQRVQRRHKQQLDGDERDDGGDDASDDDEDGDGGDDDDEPAWKRID